MAKKNKTAKNNKNADKKPASSSVIISVAENLMKQGDFKNAIKHIRGLIHIAPESYSKFMTDCNSKIFEQYLGQNNISEAGKILDELSEFCSSELLLHKRIRLSMAEGNGKKIINEFISLQNKDLLNDQLKSEILDHLIISFEDDISALRLADEDLYQDILRIQEALQKISEGLYDEALTATKPVKFSSLAARWRFLIKGMYCYYTGDDQGAEKAFRGAAVTPTLSRIAETFLNAISIGIFLAKERSNNDKADNLCTLTGNFNIKQELMRMDYLFRTGRKVDAIKHYFDLSFLPEKISTNILSELGLFYTDLAIATSSEKDTTRLEHLFHNLWQNSSGQDNNMTKLKKFFILKYLSCPGNHEFESYIKSFIAQAQQFLNDAGLIKSIVYTAAGMFFMEEYRSEKGSASFLPFLYKQKQLKENEENLKRAEDYLKKAVDNTTIPDKKSFEALLFIYQENDKKSSYNKLLDQMVKLFPNDKEILFKAGRECLERKAFSKGIEYLVKAEALDPIDKKLKSKVTEGFFDLALKYASDKKTDLMRNAFTEMLQRGIDRSDDLILGKAFQYIRCAYVEYHLNNKQEGDSFVKEAEALGISPELLLLFQLHLNTIIETESSYSKEISKKVAKLLSENINYGTAKHLLKIIDFNNSYLSEKLEKYNSRIFTYFHSLIELKLDISEYYALLLGLYNIYRDKSQEEILEITKKIVAKIAGAETDNDDLYVSFFSKYILSSFGSSRNIEDLPGLIQRAKEANETELVRIMEEYLTYLKKSKKRQPSMQEKFEEIFGRNDTIFPVCPGCGERHPVY